MRSGWGHTLFYLSILNAIAHSVMCTYSFLSTFPQMKPLLSWKRYLTTMQIGQFIIMILYMITIAPIRCGISPLIWYYTLGHFVLFIFLFGRYYGKHYQGATKALVTMLPPPPALILNASGTALRGPQDYWVIKEN